MRNLGTLLVGLTLMGLAAPALAQDTQWYENRTTNGCLFYSDYSIAGITLGWSGPCAAGRPIAGEGVLESRSTPDADGFFVLEQMSGTMQGGYWHGPVSIARFESKNGETWPAGARQTRFNMGCPVTVETCTPGVVAASASATSPDIESDDGPMGEPTPFRCGDFGTQRTHERNMKCTG